MPRIPTYDAGNLSIRPSETGVEAEAGTARRVGMFYNQAGSAEDTLARETERLAGQTQQLGRETSELGSEVGAGMSQAGRAIGSGIDAAGEAAVKYLDNQEISKGSADFTALMLQKTQQWNNIVKNADPNDPTVGPKFLASLETDLQNFKSQGGFITENGQKFAEAHIDALRQHMAEKTIGDMSALAGEAAVVNHQRTINQLSATVHGDPASLDFALATLKSSTEGAVSSNPNLTGAKANEVRMELQQKGAESIVKSAAIGYIEKTGSMPSWVTDPKYSPYVNGAELKTFEGAAKTQAKTNELYQKQIDKTNREIADQKAHAATNQTLANNVTIDPQTGRPIISPKFFSDALDIVRKNPDAPSAGATVRTMLSWGEQQQNRKAEAVITDPAVKQALTDRMFDPNNPTTRIDLMKAQVDGKLSNNDFTAMERLVTTLEQSPLKGQIWSSTTAAVKERLIRTDVKTGDKVGADNYAAFMQDFIPQYLAKSRAGTLPPNALDLRDPNSMISQSLKPYQPSMQDRLQAGAGQPSAQPIEERPPMEGARKARDGKWYVQQGNKYFRVDQ